MSPESIIIFLDMGITFLRIFSLLLFLGVIFIFWIYFSSSTVIAAKKWAPFQSTPKSVIRKALKAVNLKPNEILYDLGSGIGTGIVIAEKEFGARAIGIEYSTLLFYLSKINLFFNGVKKAKVYRENFFDVNLKEAQAIFLFLTPKAFGDLEKKFNRELKTGTRIIVYASPLPSWQPREVILLEEFKKRINLYLYVKE